jgi:hypothetical protein
MMRYGHSRLLSLDNSAAIDVSLVIRIRKVGAVAHKAARGGIITLRIQRGNRTARRACRPLYCFRRI